MIFTATSSDEGKRLDLFCTERAEITRSALQKLASEGLVTVNGKTAPKNYRIKCGDSVELTLPEPVGDKAAAQDIPIDIVYEDADIAVVNKPKGMVVHPAAGNRDGTLVNALLYRLGESLSGINGVIRPGIVHRIDKDTSGLLIVAKNDAAHVKLAEQISSHSFGRKYMALLVGNPKEDSGTVDAPIGRSHIDRKKMAIVSEGRHAVTHWRIIERFSGFSLAECTLETGRTHQIRVHMSSIGHPVAGDALYGANHTAFEKRNSHLISGQCLHAAYIDFIHPVTGEKLSFSAELPDYFKELLKELRSLSGC